MNGYPKWMLKRVGIGKMMNAWALIWTMFGSLVLLVTAEEVPDIVLNSAALMFIINIDDDLVTEKDYQYTAEILKKRKKHIDYLWN